MTPSGKNKKEREVIPFRHREVLAGISRVPNLKPHQLSSILAPFPAILRSCGNAAIYASGTRPRPLMASYFLASKRLVTHGLTEADMHAYFLWRQIIENSLENFVTASSLMKCSLDAIRVLCNKAVYVGMIQLNELKTFERTEINEKDIFATPAIFEDVSILHSVV